MIRFPEDIRSAFYSITKDAEDFPGRDLSLYMLDDFFEHLYLKKDPRLADTILPYFVEFMADEDCRESLVEHDKNGLISFIESVTESIEENERENAGDMYYIDKLYRRRDMLENDLAETTFESIMEVCARYKDSFISKNTDIMENEEKAFDLKFCEETYDVFRLAQKCYGIYICIEIYEDRYPDLSTFMETDRASVSGQRM